MAVIVLHEIVIAVFIMHEIELLFNGPRGR